ncbi:hypothetical protein DFP97_1375 [Paenibacillus prosopidis]|uniref:Uncharacterized protein n=1 Tax=Paenibacillus prosopidis TaxID=630520 RepID=A0A368VGT9_9BACL|nr:hypothetical protein DFP97_1375 [Paenibacillus prosopidis]
MLNINANSKSVTTIFFLCALVLSFIFLVPLYFTFVNSFNGVQSSPVLSLPKILHPENFVLAITKIPFWRIFEKLFDYRRYLRIFRCMDKFHSRVCFLEAAGTRQRFVVWYSHFGYDGAGFCYLDSDLCIVQQTSNHRLLSDLDFERHRRQPLLYVSVPPIYADRSERTGGGRAN